MLMQNNRVEAVLSLPGGVFQPYSGVKTSVLVFTKGGRTERVMFLHADFDGFKLDANHDQPIDADDLPDLIAAFHSRDERWRDWRLRDPAAPWTKKWWFADAARDRARGLEPVRLALPPGKPRSRRAPRPARTAGRTARRCGRDPRRCRGARRRAGGAGGVSGWPVVALADVATLSSGGTPSKARPDFWEGDIPWISPKDVKLSHIDGCGRSHNLARL